MSPCFQTRSQHLTAARFAPLLFALGACLSPLLAAGQATTDAPKPLSHAELVERFERTSVDRVHPLRHLPTVQEQNEVLTAVRNMCDPQTKIFLVPRDSAIVVRAPEEAQAQIAKLIAALDLPRARYRLTYTVTELDGAKKIGVQHFSMVIVDSQRSQVKQGSRIPLLAGPSKIGDSTVASNYIDVGLNFDATLDAIENGGSLKTRVEQTSVAPDSAGMAGGNPVIRQTSFEGTANLAFGKETVLGSMDVPSSTHHFDIEVVLQPMS